MERRRISLSKPRAWDRGHDPDDWPNRGQLDCGTGCMGQYRASTARLLHLFREPGEFQRAVFPAIVGEWYLLGVGSAGAAGMGGKINSLSRACTCGSEHSGRQSAD